MSSDSPARILYTTDSVEVALKDATTLPANARGFISVGVDGTTARFIVVDSSGRQVVAGAGTAGSPVGGVLSVQGVSGGQDLPISASQLPAALVGSRLDANVGAWLGSTAPTVGQKEMVDSVPVTVASDQTLQVSVGFVPDNLVGVIIEPLKNGSSEDMLVDGSSTPVEFVYNADATNDTYLAELRFVFGTNDLKWDTGNKFGGTNSLTNGLKVEIRSNSITTLIATIKTNEDLARYSSSGTFYVERGASDMCMGAILMMGNAVKLVAGSGDFVKVTVQDDLIDASFKYLRFMLYGAERAP